MEAKRGQNRGSSFRAMQWKRVGYFAKLVCYLEEYEPYLGRWVIEVRLYVM